MESIEDGAVISDVARRHWIRPQQLFAWRKQVRIACRLPASRRWWWMPQRPHLPSPLSHSNSAVPAEIEITADLVVIRVRGSVDMKMLTAVLRAVKAAS